MRQSRNLLVVLVLAAVGFAQKIAPPPDAASQVQKIFARFNHTDSPGCAVGASIDGVTVLNAAYGMADLEHNIALSPDSVFEPGSVTKQFTAAAVLLLAQDGKLSLDDPARKYFPELPDYATTITIRHLLNHTSGLRDWGEVASIGGWPRGIAPIRTRMCWTSQSGRRHSILRPARSGHIRTRDTICWRCWWDACLESRWPNLPGGESSSRSA